MSAGRILWGQIVVVLMLVVAGIWSATQWTAAALGHQPELGAPWFVAFGARIYPPPAFFWWWFSFDAYAPRIFEKGALIAVSGGLAGIIMAIAMSVWRAREARNAETFGTARWATIREVIRLVIEDDLGVALFERRSRRVFLTQEGERLAQAVREGLGLIATTVAVLRDQNRDGPITVSCEPTLLMRWLIPRLPAFHAAHPDIAVHLVAAGGPVTPGHGVDLAIRRSDFSLASGTQADVIFEERMGPVCRADLVDRFFDRGNLKPALRPDACLLHSRSRPDAWSEWSKAAGINLAPAPSQTLEHFYLSLQAATAGLGVAIGSWHMTRDEIASGVLAAPAGFETDGSRYLLLSPLEPSAHVRRSRQALLAWMHGSD